MMIYALQMKIPMCTVPHGVSQYYKVTQCEKVTQCDSTAVNIQMDWMSLQRINFYWSTTHSLETVYIHKVGLFQRFATISSHLDR